MTQITGLNRSDFATKIQGFKGLPKQSSTEVGSDYQDKFDSVTSEMLGLVKHKGAIFTADWQGNPIVSVPDLGSLKLTSRGCEMALLRSSTPFFGLALFSKTTKHDGMHVRLDEAEGRMYVSTIEGRERYERGNGFVNSSQGSQQSYTLDINRLDVLDYRRQELDYQFADAVSGLSGHNALLQNPPRPLFERDSRG